MEVRERRIVAVLLAAFFLAELLVAESTYALVSWGYRSEKVITADVLDVFAGRHAFAAISKGGVVENYWGSLAFGAPTKLTNVQRIATNDQAFVAITDEGYVDVWGNVFRGGRLPANIDLKANFTIVEDVVGTAYEFAAIKQGGKVSYWGLAQGRNRQLFQDVKKDLVDIRSIKSTHSAFAAISHAGQVITWGHASKGGRYKDAIRKKLAQNVTDIVNTETAFAALRTTGEVVVWGDLNSGGEFADSKMEAEVAANVTSIFSNAKAFVALKSTGQVITWGDLLSGGDSFVVQDKLENRRVRKVFSTMYAFAALLEGGEVVTWGNRECGGDSSYVSAKLRNRVISISSNNYAFAALREGGEVIAWGDPSRGGDSSLVSARIVKDVISVVGNDAAFVAIKANGAAVSWGKRSRGGQIPPELFPKLQNRVHKVVGHSHGVGFAALICLPNTIGSGCQSCPPDHIWNVSKVECEPCQDNEVPYLNQTVCGLCEQNGTVPAKNGSKCVQCLPNQVAIVGSTTCTPCKANEATNIDRSSCIKCDAGKVPSKRGYECEKCEGGSKPNKNGEVCEGCDSSSYSLPGDVTCTRCEPFWLRSKSSDGQGCVPNLGFISPTLSALIVVLISSIALGRKFAQRRQLLKKMTEVDETDIQAMKALLQLASKSMFLLRRGRMLVHDLEKQLRIQERRYTNFDALLQIIDEGNLKMVHASVLTNPRKVGERMLRQQDIEERLRRKGEEAFWTAPQFRNKARMIAVVAISYCWCHPVHPDPKGLHLMIIRHAAQLRMRMTGKGTVQDLAIFLDFMSLAQNGEAGDPENPSHGEPRTLEEEESFKKGLKVVNVPYACQLVETWILAWVPHDIKSKYEDRAWPTFERMISCLVKDSNNITCLSDEILEHEDPVIGLGLKSMKRLAPQTPKRFNEAIATKNVTSGKDIVFLQQKYLQTFTDVIQHGRSLWFANLDWEDAEALELCEIFEYCNMLATVILSGNLFSADAVKKLIEASGKCETLQSMDLRDNPIDPVEHDNIREIWINLGKKPSGLNLQNRLKKFKQFQVIEDSIDDSGTYDEQSRLLQRHLNEEKVSLFVLDEHIVSTLKGDMQMSQLPQIIGKS